MITAYDIIKALLRTEKGSAIEADRKYLFHVDRRANKIEVRDAVEEIYKVKVQAVNITNVAGKPKRVRRDVGLTTLWKKAIVTLQDGQKIEIK